MREIVYSETRNGHFEPSMSRAVKRRRDAERQNRREMILGLSIIGGAVLVYVVALVAVALV